jgi:FkbM family methyltransferase
MLQTLKRSIFETVRCARHNLKDLKVFRVTYERGRHHVRTAGGIDLVFPYYPYLSFYQIEGYLRGGKWDLPSGAVVVDAGACEGEFALYASRKVGPSGRVFMLEPDPANLAKSEEVFALNGGRPDNLVVLKEGLWKSSGELAFQAGLTSNSSLVEVGDAAPMPAANSDAAATIRVKVDSLDGLARRYGLGRMDFVKMDIEGAEIEAVEGAADVMARFKPKFAIAAYHVRDGEMTHRRLEPMFRAAGYHADSGFPQHLTTYASAEPLP